LLLVAPLGILFFIVPPQEPVVRYLVPALPALIAIMVRYAEKDLKVQYSVRALAVSLVLAHMFGAASRAGVPAATRDEVLLTGLSNGINRLAYEDDHVLLYNIQGQYAIKAPCHDLSGSVGNELADVLLRRTGIDEFILANNVRYVVTSDDLESRALFENTLLRELSRQDPTCNLGDTVVLGGLAFEKLFSHSAFARRAAAHQAGVAALDGSPGPIVAAPVTRGRYDTRWNTVYRVLGEASVPTSPTVAYYETGDEAVLEESGTPVDGAPMAEGELQSSEEAIVTDESVQPGQATPVSESPEVDVESVPAEPVAIPETTGGASGP